MTVLAQDNFDSDTVGAIAPGWAAKIGTWAVGTSNPVSAPNSFGATSNTDGDVALYTGAGTTANMSLALSMIQSRPTASFTIMGIVLRSDLANNNNYTIVFSNGSGSSIVVTLFKKVSGTYSQVGMNTVAFTQASGNTIKVKASISGATISVFLGVGTLPGSPITSFTDSSITGVGYAGLYNGKDSSVVSMTIDDFVLDDLAATADTTAPTLTGSVTIGTVTSSTVAASWPIGADNVAVTGYEYSLNSGSSWNSVGNVTSASIPVVPATTYPAIQVRAFDAANNKSNPAISSASGFTTPAAPVALDTSLVTFSPYNWALTSSTAKTINPGAYFKTVFGGTACTLNFDMTGITSPLPQISYRVDRHSAWTTVPIAASLVIAIPSDTADYANKGGHLLEVLVKSMTETQTRWSPQTTAVSLTGIILDSGKVCSAPPALPTSLLFYGDSITEGVRTVNSTATNDIDRNDAAQCWSLEVARILGMEASNVGFGGSGFTVTGSGGIPVLGASYNQIYSGFARSFATSPAAIILMEGTNDGGDVTSAATGALNSLIAATTSKIIVLRPFNGTAHASQLQAAIAACSTPSRCTYVDTAGWFTTANSSDNLHPYGVENLTHIAPLAANAVRSVLNASPTLTARTVTVSGLKTDATTLATGLINVKVSLRDAAGPDIVGLLSYQSSTQTITAGVLSFTANTTLGSGATGWIDVKAPGLHYCGQVVVS